MSEIETKALNEKILPKVLEIHSLIKGFHGQQINDLQGIINSMESVEDELREKQEQCETYINQIKNKRKEQDKFGQLSKGVLEAKLEQIKSKVKNIDAVSAGIKESVGKIKAQKLSKLPVTKDRNLTKLFTVVYQTLYSEASPELDWENFKKLALKHENGEDFIFRLVNINFKQLPEDKYNKLLELKSDPEFEHMSVKSQHAYDIIDIADWVDYVCLGHQFSLEKKRAEKDYDKIRKDIDKKSKGSLQMSENFWKEASSEIENYQNQIQSISSDLKTMMFGLKKSIENCNENQDKTNRRIQDLVRS